MVGGASVLVFQGGSAGRGGAGEGGGERRDDSRFDDDRTEFFEVDSRSFDWTRSTTPTRSTVASRSSRLSSFDC